MNPEPSLADPKAESAAREASLLDAAWADRSSEELLAIVQHGLSAGKSFAGAARELERRARVVTLRAEQDSEAQEAMRKTFVRYLITGLAIVAVAGLLTGLFLL